MIRFSAALLLVAALAGCERRPTHKGPDVALVPAGFVYEPGVTAARNLFPERPKVLERGYTTAAFMDDDNSNIMITEYDGPTTAAQVEEAVLAEQKRYGHADYGPIEPLEIDRHEAWAWTQTQPKGAPQVRAMQYRVVVSYPEATYLVEFYTTHRRFLDRPDQIKESVASFRVRD